MKFEAYIAEMKRLGWSDEELEKDYELERAARINGTELPWFPVEKTDSKEKDHDRNL